MKTTIKILMVLAFAVIGFGANAQQVVVEGSTYTYKTTTTSTVIAPIAVEYEWTVTPIGAAPGTPLVADKNASKTAITWDKAGKYTVTLVETIVYDNAGTEKRCDNVEIMSYEVEVMANDFNYDFGTVPAEGVCANEAGSFIINITDDNDRIEYPIKVTYTLPDEGDAGHPSVDHGTTLDFAKGVDVELLKEAYVKATSAGFYVAEGSDVFDAVLTVTKIEDNRGVVIVPTSANTITLKVNRNPVKKEITFE